MVGPILLLPELCLILSLSDEICSYFPITKDVSRHTQISSTERGQELLSFMNDHQTNLQAEKEMRQWNLNFNLRLLKKRGRTHFPK